MWPLAQLIWAWIHKGQDSIRMPTEVKSQYTKWECLSDAGIGLTSGPMWILCELMQVRVSTLTMSLCKYLDLWMPLCQYLYLWMPLCQYLIDATRSISLFVDATMWIFLLMDATMSISYRCHYVNIFTYGCHYVNIFTWMSLCQYFVDATMSISLIIDATMSLSLVMDASMAVSYRCHCVSIFSVDFLSTSIHISTIKRQHDVHSLCYTFTFHRIAMFVSGH